MEVEFSKLNLKEGDILVVKAKTASLVESEIKDKLTAIREDPFIKFVESKGHPVYVTYSGLDLQILRLQEGDSVVVYASVRGMDETQKEDYLNLLKTKLSDLEDRLYIIPVDNTVPKINVIDKETKERAEKARSLSEDMVVITGDENDNKSN